MTVIGNADITIGADASAFERQLDSLTRKITRTVEGNLSRVASASNTELAGMVSNVASTLQSVGSKLTNFITVPIGGAVAAAGTLVTALGFKRLVGIDTARAQFKGLGYDANAVMEQVDKGVTNTSLSMAEGAAAAVSILATGSVPLEGLEDQIQRVANVSAAYQVDATHANRLLNNVLTKNKVTYGDLSQMVTNGIPIWTMLAEEIGVTGEEIQRMASAGEISIEQLNAAIDASAGMAAQAYAESWRGITANTIANLGKIGAKLMEPSFEIIKDKAQDFLTFLQSGDLASWADEWGAKIGAVTERIVAGISRVVEWFTNLSPAAQKTIGVFGALAVAAGPFITFLGTILTGVSGLITRFPALGAAISNVAAMFSRGLSGASGASFTFAGRMGLLVQQGGGLVKVLSRVAGIAGLVITALVSMWQNSESFRTGVQQLFSAIWSLVSTALKGLFDIFTALSPIFDTAGGLVGKLAGILGDILGGALQFIAPILEWLADLLGVVLTAAADGLATAISWLVDAFSSGGDGATAFGAVADWLKGVWESVSSWFTGSFLPAMSSVWEGIQAAVGPVVDWFQTHVGPVFEAWGELFSAVFDRVGEKSAATFEWLQEAWGKISENWGIIWQAVQSLWESVGAPIFNAILDTWRMVWEGIQQVWEVVGPYIIEGIAAGWEAVKVIFETVWNNIVIVFQTVWDILKTVVETILGVIAGIISAITAVIRGDWSAAWEAIKGIFETIWNGIKSIVETIFNGVKNFIQNTLNGTKALWENVWSAISSFLRGAWEGMKVLVTVAINFIRNTITNIINGIRSTWQNVWNAISSFFSNVWRKIQNAASNYFNGVRQKFSDMISFVRDIPSKILNIFSNIGTLLLNSGRALVDGFLDGIKNAWSTLTSWVADALQSVRDLFPFSPAKTGPFSGRGWVDRSGESLGSTFANSVVDSLHKGERGIESTLGTIADDFHGLQLPTLDAFDSGLALANALADGLLEGESEVVRAAERITEAAAAASGVRDMYGGGMTSGSIVNAAPAPFRSGGADHSGTGAGGTGAAGAGGISFNFKIENMRLDSDDRVKQLAQELYTRAERSQRAQGKVNLGGTVR